MENVVNTGKNVVKRAEKECPGKNFPGHRRRLEKAFLFLLHSEQHKRNFKPSLLCPDVDVSAVFGHSFSDIGEA